MLGLDDDDDDDDDGTTTTMTTKITLRGGATTPTPHPIKIKACSVFNENRYLGHIWCGESENDSPDGQRQKGGAGPSNRC